MSVFHFDSENNILVYSNWWADQYITFSKTRAWFLFDLGPIFWLYSQWSFIMTRVLCSCVQIYVLVFTLAVIESWNESSMSAYQSYSIIVYSSLLQEVPILSNSVNLPEFQRTLMFVPSAWQWRVDYVSTC